MNNKKKETRKSKSSKRKSYGDKGWIVTSCSHEDDIKEALSDGFEPFAVDGGRFYFKKKGK